jgi:hypothetical protein
VKTFVIAALVLAPLTVGPHVDGQAEVDRLPPLLGDVRVDAPGPPFAGDDRLLTTISPNGDGLRDTATISFTLSEPAHVTLEIGRTTRRVVPIYTRSVSLRAGRQSLAWSGTGAAPRTYVVLLTAVDAAGNRSRYGARTRAEARRRRTAAVRVLGVDAAADRASYAPGEVAHLTVATDARSLSIELVRSGPEGVETKSTDVMKGVPLSPAATVAWVRFRHAPRTLPLRIPDVPTGLHFLRLVGNDGRVGHAPFVIRPKRPSRARVAIVLPALTWQAYNVRDEDGDGWGETWYAGPDISSVRLGRAYLDRGVPPRFRFYDLGFVRWLAVTNRSVDYLTELDLERFRNGDALARAYDLVVFPGHTEYVTRRIYDVVERYRDLGGNLMFLSANNFFWAVQRSGAVLHRTRLWRTLGRPEAGLIGVQYRGSDDGSRKGLYVVRRSARVSWLFEGTGLRDGSTFGADGRGLGIEIDATASASPAGIVVAAEIPHLYGRGYTAQMTYYETPRGAKVFAAGTLDFGGHALYEPIRRLLLNAWARLSTP